VRLDRGGQPEPGQHILLKAPTDAPLIGGDEVTVVGARQRKTNLFRAAALTDRGDLTVDWIRVCAGCLSRPGRLPPARLSTSPERLGERHLCDPPIPRMQVVRELEPGVLHEWGSGLHALRQDGQTHAAVLYP
jgi:hypothetical protein